ncbi:MAG: DUF3833 domain-containing protein [Paraglaciecola sp.]|nr:DUF3833 domain-containing protein [Paraglaciecola sp.]NCT48537.1 DUF3833 domain-containing protein [Paraglaciecola sp.]
MRILPALAITVMSSTLLSCSVELSDYQASQPKFDLPDYFNGELTAWGILQDYTGKMTRHFCVDLVGTWQGNAGQLHESFYFDDGEQQTRIWSIQIQPDGSITGTAGDVVGQATGNEQGAAFNWQYTLQVPVGDSTYDFAVDDWMFRLDDNRVMNRSYMQKLGITVAEISIFFDKTAPLRRCNQE